MSNANEEEKLNVASNGENSKENTEDAKEGLNEEQYIKLLNFQAMTEIEDEALAIYYLDSNDWDESKAVNDYMKQTNNEGKIKISVPNTLNPISFKNITSYR